MATDPDILETADLPTPVESRSSFRIMIADDEPVARSLLRAILQQEGYTQIDEFADGQQAMDAIEKNTYDAVLLDKNMPHIDGLIVLEKGKALQPGCEFIMITAYGSMETAIQAMDLGAFSYVTKPFSDIDIIAARIGRALERVAVRRENEELTLKMNKLVEELDQAETRLEQMVATGNDVGAGERQQLSKVRDAIGRLREMSRQLESLRKRATGRAADLFGRMGRTVEKVADLLDGE